MSKKLLLGLVGTLTLSACSVSFSTANLGDVSVCAELDASGACPANAQITSTSTIVNALVPLNNSPAGTTVKAEWWLMEPEQLITDVVYVSKDNENMATFSLTPNKGLPVGSYEVRFFLNDATEATKVVPFAVN